MIRAFKVHLKNNFIVEEPILNEVNHLTRHPLTLKRRLKTFPFNNAELLHYFTALCG